MRQKDHRLLAGYLLRKLNSDALVRHHFAFRIGAIEPDYDPFSFLRGRYTKDTFAGHSAVNGEYHICALLQKLSEKSRLSALDCYRLGKLTHFLADAFTYTHNPAFHGSLREHLHYERRLLHPPLHMAMCNERQQNDVDAADDLWEYYQSLHRRYLRQSPSVQTDIQYILTVCLALCRRIVPA